MLAFEFFPHPLLFCVSFNSLPLPLSSSPGQSFTARLAESRHSPFLPVCVCAYVRATGQEPSLCVCAHLSANESSNRARLLRRLKSRKARDWSVFRSIHGSETRLAAPPPLSPLRSPTSLHYLPLFLFSCLSLLTRDYVR